MSFLYGEVWIIKLPHCWASTRRSSRPRFRHQAQVVSPALKGRTVWWSEFSALADSHRRADVKRPDSFFYSFSFNKTKERNIQSLLKIGATWKIIWTGSGLAVHYKNIGTHLFLTAFWKTGNDISGWLKRMPNAWHALVLYLIGLQYQCGGRDSFFLSVVSVFTPLCPEPWPLPRHIIDIEKRKRISISGSMDLLGDDEISVALIILLDAVDASRRYRDRRKLFW